MRRTTLQFFIRIACLLAIGLGFQTAMALPVTAGGVLSGFRGDTVSPTLIDQSLSGFEGADFKLTYDPAYLSFVSALPGSLTGGSSIIAGAPTANGSLLDILISLATPGPVSGGPGSVFEANFLIDALAPIGSTLLRFESVDRSLYDFEPFFATVNVLSQSTVPIGSTGVLAALGLLALAAMRRHASSVKRG